MLILKLMGPEDMADSSTHKSFELIPVHRVSFHRMDGYSVARAYIFDNAYQGFEDITLQGNAYVLNDKGQTVETFAHAPRS